MKYWVDPPAGWQYGFPKLYDSEVDGDMTAWLVKHGYPVDEYPDVVRAWPYEEGDDD